MHNYDELARAHARYMAGDAQGISAAQALLLKDPSFAEAGYFLYWAIIGLKGDASGYQKFKDALNPTFLAMERGRAHLNWHEWPEEVRRLKALGSALEFRGATRYLISYPKCGRTWLRYMIGLYLSGDESLDLKRHWQLHAAGSSQKQAIQVTHDDLPHWKPASEIARQKDIYSNCQIAFLARDPRDVLISNFMQFKHRDPSRTAKMTPAVDVESPATFMRSPYGVENIVTFYNAWAEATHVPAAFLMVSYEDMRANTAAVLTRVLEFFGTDADGARAARVAAACDFETLAALERGMASPLGVMGSATPEVEDSFKVRRGVVGGYADYLSGPDIAWLNAYLRDNLHPLYEAYRVG